MGPGPGTLKTIGSFLPYPVVALVRAMRRRARVHWYRGSRRWCPVCGYSARRFLRHRTRGEAECAQCCSLERHRFVWLYFAQRTDLFDKRPKRVLHVAPESGFEPRLRSRLGPGYLTADLLDPDVMERMDITRIPYSDESFDVIYCSHVLEHVPDDQRAMREFRRVLKRSGWAVLMVPITADETFEDPTVVRPSDRLRVFGQEDHVRRYGPDYVDRLQRAGFDVDVTRVSDMIPADEAARMGLTQAEAIYHCTRA